jgi:hypothetical protein
MQRAVRVTPDHVGEGAAAVDPEIPNGHVLVPGSVSDYGQEYIIDNLLTRCD